MVARLFVDEPRNSTSFKPSSGSCAPGHMHGMETLDGMSVLASFLLYVYACIIPTLCILMFIMGYCCCCVLQQKSRLTSQVKQEATKFLRLVVGSTGGIRDRTMDSPFVKRRRLALVGVEWATCGSVSCISFSIFDVSAKKSRHERRNLVFRKCKNLRRISLTF